MTKSFPLSRYGAAREYAQAWADRSGMSVGIEKMPGLSGEGEYVVRLIPAYHARYGCDHTCEAVDPARAL